MKSKSPEEKQEWVPISEIELDQEVITRRNHLVRVIDRNTKYIIVDFNRKRIECPNWMLVRNAK